MFTHWSVMYPYSYNTTPDLLATIRQSLLIKQQNICWTSVLRSPTASACRMKYRYTPQRVYIGPNSGCWIRQRLSDEVRMYDRMSVYRSLTVLVGWRICMFQGVYYMYTIDILLFYNFMHTMSRRQSGEQCTRRNLKHKILEIILSQSSRNKHRTEVTIKWKKNKKTQREIKSFYVWLWPPSSPPPHQTILSSAVMQ